MKKLLMNMFAIVAVLIIAGCGGISTGGIPDVPMPIHNSYVVNDPASYPQMYTPEMLERMETVEKAYNVKFLGAYTFDGEWIIWAIEKATGKCVGNLLFSDGSVEEESCETAYEIYRAICADVGNCI